jgi:hypothetical protein
MTFLVNSELGHIHLASLLEAHLARDSQVFIQRGRVSGHGDWGVSAGGGGGVGGTADVEDCTVEVCSVEGADVVLDVAGGGGGATLLEEGGGGGATLVVVAGGGGRVTLVVDEGGEGG